MDSGEGVGGMPPYFGHHLFFFFNFVLFEAELIISNAPLTYVYANTLEIWSTPNHLLFGRQLLNSLLYSPKHDLQLGI